MVDYSQSSQLHQWLFRSPEEYDLCRSKANFKAREFLGDRSKSKSGAEAEQAPSESPAATPPPVLRFACGFSKRLREGKEDRHDYSSMEPQQTANGKPVLTVQEEATLIRFYASKLPSLIGPLAQVPRLRRESKVTATAAILYRRFFLSNSVMLFDPKAIMVGAAFLASKVQDATADVRYLEEGTTVMNAPVTTSEIITAELALLEGIHFDLLCFHPYKALVALTEDLRTFLKTTKGRQAVTNTTDSSSSSTGMSGSDLKPLYDAARQCLDQVIVSELPLLYSPGQIALASLMWAQQQQTSSSSQTATTRLVDWMAYLRMRFPEERTAPSWMEETLHELMRRLSDILAAPEDLAALKAIHKKLKKVRVWGKKSSKQHSNKRPASTSPEPPAKRVKA